MTHDQKLALSARQADASGLHGSPGLGPALVAASPFKAATSTRAAPSKASSPPKPQIHGLTVSKQWVLPPRPKPGRKPKPKPEPKSNKGASGRAANTNHGSGKNSGNNNGSFPMRTEQLQSSAPPVSPADSSIKPDKTSVEDDDCMLCSRDDCMCETIGLKQHPASPHSPRKSAHSLDMILNGPTVIMDAVPLKRPKQDPTLRSEGGITKFPRTKYAQPVHPKHVLSVPSPLEGLQTVTDSCGFCTENTACACAEVANSAPTPPLMQSSILPSSSGRSPMASSPLAASHIAISPMTMGYPHMAYPQFSAPPVPPRPAISIPGADDACFTCAKDAMSMLFCLSLTGAGPLSTESVSIPCHLAYKTLQKHPRFEGCDLGMLVRRLDVSPSRQVGVQSINRVLQDLERGEFPG